MHGSSAGALLPDVSVVTTPAVSTDMTTVETVKTELGITTGADDARLLTLIRQASGDAVRYCKRVFARETLLDTFRPRYRRVGPLMLRRSPVDAIASITVDGTVLVGADYELDLTDDNPGFVWRLDSTTNLRSCWTGGVILVGYTAGYAMVSELPEDLERAIIDLVKQRWFAGRRDPLVRSEDVPGVLSTQYWVGGIGDDGALPPSVAATFDRYREISV